MRFTEVIKHFWSLEATSYFFGYIHFRIKSQVSVGS